MSRAIGNLSKFSKWLLFLILVLVLIFGVIAPVSYLLFSSTSDFLYSNQTEGSNLGTRLSAAVLDYEFNSAAENITVIDSSIYQNNGGLD